MNRKNLLLANNKKGFERPEVPEGLFPLYLEYDKKERRIHYIYPTETTKTLYDYLRQLIFAVGEYCEYPDGSIEYWIADTEAYGVELYIDGCFIDELWVNSIYGLDIIYFTYAGGLIEGQIYSDGNIDYIK